MDIVDEVGTIDGYQFINNIAFAYQQVGRIADADQLLDDSRDELEQIAAERGMDYPPYLEVLAANQALRGDNDSAIATLNSAYELGWRNYYWVKHDVAWSKFIQMPEVTELLETIRKDIEAQKQRVLDADAEHDFRAEIERMTGR